MVSKTCRPRAVGIYAQKCCEIQELWPSQDFARPAGNDRFAPDETAVYCINSNDGATVTLNSDPASISAGDYIGINTGIYSVAAVDHSAWTVTLGTLKYPLPAGFSLPSADTDQALWKIRFPDAPAILGRDAIASLAGAGSSATTITLSSPEANLMTSDAIDICSTNITHDSNGNLVSESMSAIASNVTVTRVDDSNFTVPVAIGALTGAAYITSHSTTSTPSTSLWYWDDNGRKGDFTTYQWTYDYRTNAEVARLASVTDCSGNMPPSGTPGPNNGFSAFSQTQGSLKFTPCCYSCIAITPNGETWPNAVVIPFPSTFNFDDRYGARWQGEIEQAMMELYWQAPHRPCTVEIVDTWNMDDGTCKPDAPNDAGGEDKFYPHFPFVESRISLPINGGNSQTETAPPLPAGITVGHDSPVTYPALPQALYPPGTIGYDPASGNPSPAWTIWSYRQTIEDNTCFGGCRFNYVDMENLPCVTSYTPPPPSAPADANTATGMTDQGLT